jgi:hypothetical protein
VHHVALLVAVHALLLVTVTVYEPPFAGSSMASILTDNTGISSGTAGSLPHEAAVRSSVAATNVLIVLIIILNYY